MIKDFDTYINEDYFSKLASRKDNGNVRKEDEITEDFIRSFVIGKYQKDISSIKFRKKNDVTLVDIVGDFILKKDTKEIPFQLGKVTGDFDCSCCYNLESFKGCPKEVGGDFVCSRCTNLTSLEGCPEIVGGGFACPFCYKLKSLDYCPKEVGGDFVCWDCGTSFTEDEVKSLCNVKGKIEV